MNMMKKIDSIDLIYVDDSTNSNKEYHLQLVETTPGLFDVNAQWGRRGNMLQMGQKISGVPLDKARKVFDKTRDEKLGKGYVPDPDSAVSVIPGQDLVTKSVASMEKFLKSMPVQNSPVIFPEEPAPVVQEHIEGNFKRKIRVQWNEEKEVRYIPQLLNPIEKDELQNYLLDNAWGLQEKKDGVHVMVKIINEPLYQGMKVFNKKGKEIPFLKEWQNEIGDACLLDGEKINDTYHVFDLLEHGVDNLRLSGYETRYKRLSKLMFSSKFKLVPLAIGYKTKRELYERLLKEDKEGVVFKKLDAIFTPGKAHNTMVKFKFTSTASVRVTKGREGKQSFGMELLDENGKWVFMGNCTALNKTVPLGSIAEIKFLYVQGKGGHLYQPVFLGLRDDVDESECTTKQLKYKPNEEN